MANFIPSFHFDDPASKLTSEWCNKVKNYYYYNNSRRNLLYGKKIDEIEQYFDGEFSMVPFKKMFKSMKKKLDAIKINNPDGTMSSMAADIDTLGIDWAPLPLIPVKMNSAIASISKTPVDITCSAQDALAMKKRKEDVEFLKNKPKIEADLADLVEQMGVELDLGTTKNSGVNFSEAPAGLDLSNSEHEEIFMKLFYSLKVETAFEKTLKQFYNIKSGDINRLMAIKDQFKWGVSAWSTYNSAITGLPDLDYIHPSRIETPESDIPDYSDNNHRVTDYTMTVEEMFNYFGDEICDEETLEKIINGSDGYCDQNLGHKVDSKNWATFKVNLKFIEVKSIDWVGVKEKKKSKKGFQFFTTDLKECSSRIWGQNTYTFFWLFNTNYYFKIQRLPYSYRTKGKEAYQNFTTIIYKSQRKSAVELSISENKKAQIADIKMQHALIKSAPPGKYIDLRFLRNAVAGLKESKYTVEHLMELAVEHNWFIGDTEGFDGKNDGQLKPFIDIPGGLKDEIRGYLQVIVSCSQNIAGITGINENLTGQTAEELVGLQQLRINSGLNAINYCNDAIKYKLEVLNNVWASLTQAAVEKGGKTKQAIVNMIGFDDTELLDSFNEAPLHDLTIKVEVGPRFNEMQAFMNQLNIMKQRNQISAIDEYMLGAIDNPKEKMQKLYFIEEKWKKEQEKIRTEGYANQQAIVQQQGQNMMQNTQLEGQQDINKEYAKGDVNAKLMQLGAQIGMSQKQLDDMNKRLLQKERNDGQTEKGIKIMQAKKQQELQQAL